MNYEGLYKEPQKTLIHFNSIDDLYEFRNAISDAQAQINARNMTILCTCRDAEIELARNAFKATIVPCEKK